MIEIIKRRGVFIATNPHNSVAATCVISMRKSASARSISAIFVAFYMIGCSDSGNTLLATNSVDSSPRAISAGPLDVHGELVLTSTPPDAGAALALNDALLNNGDLEQGNDGWFDCTGSSGSEITTDASSGIAALAVPAAACVYSVSFAVSAGDAIVLTCDTKLSDSSQWAGLGMGFSSVQWQAVGEAPTTLVTSSEFTRYTVSATVPNGTYYTSIWFYSESAATIDNCELSLKQAGSGTTTRAERDLDTQAGTTTSAESSDGNLLLNPGFLASAGGVGITDWFIGCDTEGVAQANSGDGLKLAGSACVAQSFSAEILGALRGNRYSFQCETAGGASAEYADVVISLNGVETTESKVENGLTNISGRAPDNLSTGMVTVYSEYATTDPLIVESCSLTVETSDETDSVEPTDQATSNVVYDYYLIAADTISIDSVVGGARVFVATITAPAGVEFLDVFTGSNPNEFSVKTRNVDTGAELLFYYTRTGVDKWELQPTTDTEIYDYYTIAADTIAIDRLADDGWLFVTEITAPEGVEFLNVFPGSNPNEFSVKTRRIDTGVESVAYYARTGASSWELQPAIDGDVFEYYAIAPDAISVVRLVGDDQVYVTEVTSPLGVEFLDVFPGSNPYEFSVKTRHIDTGIEFTSFYGRTGETEWTVLPATAVATVFDYYPIAADNIAIDQLTADGWTYVSEVIAPEGAEFLNVYRGSDPEEFFVQTKIEGAALYSIYYYARTEANTWELKQKIEADSRQMRSLDYEPSYESFPTKIVTGGDIMVAATGMGVITDQSTRGSTTANETYLDIYRKENGVWQHVTGVDRVYPDNYNQISTLIVTAEEIFLTIFTDSITYFGVISGTVGGENSEIAVLQRNEGGTDAWGLSQIIPNPPELADFGRPLKLSDGLLSVGSAAGDATSEYKRNSNGTWVLLSDDGEDIPVNGNFQSITDGTPTGWTVGCGGDSFNTTDVNGEQGVQLNDNTCAKFQLDANALALLAGKSYKFGCRIDESSGLPSIEIRYNNGSYTLLDTTSDTVGTYITVQGSAPADIITSTLELASVNQTSFYDCKLTVWSR